MGEAEKQILTALAKLAVADENASPVEENEKFPDFPRLPGALGELVDGITDDIGYELKALALITVVGLILSGKVVLASDKWLQPRFYSLLISPPNGGKTAAIKEVENALREILHRFGVRIERALESGPALVQALLESDHLLYSPDEMADGFEKAKVPGNSLFGEFLRLYESNVTGNRTKRTKQNPDNVIEVINGHFAALGGVAELRFDEMWRGTSAALSGLRSRWCYGYSDKVMPRLKKPNDDDVIQHAVDELSRILGTYYLEGGAPPKAVDLSLEAQHEIVTWTMDDSAEESRRAVDMAKRFALLITASLEQDTISGTAMLLGIQFADYLIACRQRFDQPDTANHVDAMEKRIGAYFLKRPGMRVSQGNLQSQIKPDRLKGGMYAWNAAWRALTSGGVPKLVQCGKSQRGEVLFQWR